MKLEVNYFLLLFKITDDSKGSSDNFYLDKKISVIIIISKICYWLKPNQFGIYCELFGY